MKWLAGAAAVAAIVTVSGALAASGSGGGGGGDVSSPTPTAVALPDLQATAKASTGSPAAGAQFFLLFETKDGGKAVATDVTFNAVVPDGLVIINVSDGSSGCTLTGRVVSCAITSELYPGTVRGVQIDVYAPLTAGIFAVTGSFADSNGDSNLANNSATVSIAIK
jgi:hypothetical protein